MKTLKGAFGLTLILLTCVSAKGAQVSGDSTSSLGVLSYSSESGQHPNPLVFKSRGQAYRLSLVPEKDTAGQVVVLDLVLQKNDSKDNETNLLDTTGKLHGYQKYFFAASDFVHGAQQSAYGDKRDVAIRNLGMEVQVEVVGVAVAPVTENAPNPTQYQFSNLRLRISTHRMPGGGSPSSGQ